MTRAARVLGWFGLAGAAPAAAVLTLLRAVPALQELPGAGLVASFSAYGLLGWLAVAAFAEMALRGRSRLIVLVAALALAGLHTAWIAPYYVADD